VAVLHGDASIGYAILEHADPAMGVASGRFFPSGNYLRVRSVLKIFAEAQDLRGQAAKDKLRDYYTERDRLGLRLRDDNARVVPTSWIHIIDFGESNTPTAEDEIMLEASISDPTFFGK
jgi:hypothetical protein